MKLGSRLRHTNRDMLNDINMLKLLLRLKNVTVFERRYSLKYCNVYFFRIFALPVVITTEQVKLL